MPIMLSRSRKSIILQLTRNSPLEYTLALKASEITGSLALTRGHRDGQRPAQRDQGAFAGRHSLLHLGQHFGAHVVDEILHLAIHLLALHRCTDKTGQLVRGAKVADQILLPEFLPQACDCPSLLLFA